MSGTDASFLYFETPATHMHVLGTLVVDTTDCPDWSADSMIELLQHRLDLLRPFRQRLGLAMLRLHHPVWIDVPDVDVREHVSRVRCPRPGTMVELAHEVAAFASGKLDRSRPLWECLVVEDMADNKAAVVFKIHHCAVDGVGAARILSALFDLAPEGRTEAELIGAREEARALQKPEPSVLDVAVHTATGLMTRPWHTARVGVSGAKALVNIVGRRVGDADTSGGALPLTAPRAPFNGSITPGRAVAYVDVALADVKAIKSAVGGTFNDAVTAITGGALRSYLLKRDALPDASLIATVPVSIRGDESDLAANRVSTMFTSLGTDVADPLERLQAVHRANQVAKGDQKAMGDDLVSRVGEAAPPNTTAALARLYSMLRFADLHPVVHNLVLSNVAGPPFQIYMAGAKVDGIYPLGPVMEGPGLNITIVSYRDRVGFGIIACSDRLPDIDDLAAEFPATVEEMLLAAR